MSHYKAASSKLQTRTLIPNVRAPSGGENRTTHVLLTPAQILGVVYLKWCASLVQALWYVLKGLER
jgi:hypothetical protein